LKKPMPGNGTCRNQARRVPPLSYKGVPKEGKKTLETTIFPYTWRLKQGEKEKEGTRGKGGVPHESAPC